jgi:starvation-inducible DNA-binding protein
MKLYASPSGLPEAARKKIVVALQGVLTDGIDLYGQIKIAHWNIKGPLFASLHPLLDTMATAVAGFNDEIAERCVTLGGLAVGSAKHVAANTSLAEYSQTEVRDLVHAKEIAKRFGAFVKTAKAGRAVADRESDLDTSDLLTGVIEACEKHAWFLLATTES